MSEGGMLAGLPGCRAMGRAARPWCTKASSSAVTPRCTLLTCSQPDLESGHLPIWRGMADSPLCLDAL